MPRERIGGNDQVKQMQKVRDRILDLLLKEFQHNTEGHVMAGGALQVVVGLLNKYPTDIRTLLAEGMIMVLKGERDDESPIIIPGSTRPM